MPVAPWKGAVHLAACAACRFKLANSTKPWRGEVQSQKNNVHHTPSISNMFSVHFFWMKHRPCRATVSWTSFTYRQASPAAGKTPAFQACSIEKMSMISYACWWERFCMSVAALKGCSLFSGMRSVPFEVSVCNKALQGRSLIPQITFIIPVNFNDVFPYNFLNETSPL